MTTNSPEAARLAHRLEALARLIDDAATADGERESALRRYGEARNALRRMERGL